MEASAPSLEGANMPKQPKAPLKVWAVYDGKALDMERTGAGTEIPPGMRFHLACMRITDNNHDGYAVEGDKVYRVLRSKRTAMIVKDGDERARVLALIPKGE